MPANGLGRERRRCQALDEGPQASQQLSRRGRSFSSPSTNAANSMSLPLTGFLLSNCRLPRDFKLLRIVVHPRQGWRGLKWIV